MHTDESISLCQLPRYVRKEAALEPSPIRESARLRFVPFSRLLPLSFKAHNDTSDEVLSWNQITETIAAAAGLEPQIMHIPSDFIAAVEPELGPGLLGDKSHSLVFDNSKIKRFVPGWEAVVPFAEGVARSLAWFEADPSRKAIDEKWSAQLDRIVTAYETGRFSP